MGCTHREALRRQRHRRAFGDQPQDLQRLECGGRENHDPHETDHRENGDAQRKPRDARTHRAKAMRYTAPAHPMARLTSAMRPVKVASRTTACARIAGATPTVTSIAAVSLSSASAIDRRETGSAVRGAWTRDSPLVSRPPATTPTKARGPRRKGARERRRSRTSLRVGRRPSPAAWDSILPRAEWHARAAVPTRTMQTMTTAVERSPRDPPRSQGSRR